MTRPLYLKDAGDLDLFFHTCVCGELTVHGFYHQLKKIVYRDRFKVALLLQCKSCDTVKVKWLRLTTSPKKRKRWVNWTLVWCAIAPHLPTRWVKWFTGWIMWLEVRLPV